MASTPRGFKLTSVGNLRTYASLLSRACKQLHTVVVYTPHSPRAGWASWASKSGLSMEMIRTHGRWSSDKALKSYMDVVGSMNDEGLNCHLNMRAHWLGESFVARYPWW